MNWIEADARRRQIILRDGPEQWRNLRLLIECAVGSWIRIYNRPDRQEIQFSNCAEVTEDCFRVRTIPPPGQPERYVEVRYQRDEGIIRSGPSPFRLMFVFSVGEDGTLGLVEISDPESAVPTSADVSIEAVARRILDPFIRELGQREPLVDLR